MFGIWQGIGKGIKFVFIREIHVKKFSQLGALGNLPFPRTGRLGRVWSDDPVRFHQLRR